MTIKTVERKRETAIEKRNSSSETTVKPFIATRNQRGVPNIHPKPRNARPTQAFDKLAIYICPITPSAIKCWTTKSSYSPSHKSAERVVRLITGDRSIIVEVGQYLRSSTPRPSADATSTALAKAGHVASERTGTGCCTTGVRLQNRKTEGRQHPDRDRQFRHVVRKADECQRRGDRRCRWTRRRSWWATSRTAEGNGGRRDLEQVLVHSFMDSELGKANPYGVHGLAANNGRVGVDVDHLTAVVRGAYLRRWWERMGKAAYPARRCRCATSRRERVSGKRPSTVCSAGSTRN